MKHINRYDYQAFPYHLVEPSPWPILTSLALLTFTVSAVLYFQGFSMGGELLALGFVLTAAGMILWFRDVITEGTYLGDHTSQVQKGLTLGVALFIVSEVFAFISVFWAYFHSSLAPTIEIGSAWPPVGITPLDPFAIPLLNTILLLSSGATITYAHHSLIQGNRNGAIFGTILTFIFAIAFTGLQYFEYKQATFTIADSVFGTVFFASTGLHGLHVIVGTLFILVGFFRILAYHLTDHHHLGFESAILYWHFVDVVWLFLYISVYYWGY
jgi:cytochrome c oxidase subunit 3